MIKKVLFGDYLKRLDNIKQWQEMDVFNHESVSQHSYKVAIFCRVLLEDIFGSDNQSEFRLRCLSRALLHDWDEALIYRDMSHEIKYNSFNGSDIRRVLDDFVRNKAKIEFAEGEGNTQSDASKMMIYHVIETDGTERKLVKFCDWLALLFYVKREQDLGNQSLKVQWERCIENTIRAANELKEALDEEFPEVVKNYSEINNIINSL